MRRGAAAGGVVRGRARARAGEGGDDAPADLPTLLASLLAEQQDLAPVERFARRAESAAARRARPRYEDLIPLSAPAPGEQYAFRVDLDRCTGCKACVAACHSLNGLEADESWRRVGVLYGTAPAAPAQVTVTTACHHCEDPACLSGCPVAAYEKDPATGIVRHLDDQCIGCRYCTLTCPYDVPRYSAARGIVRKCDLCAGRLAAGEAPACVQGCPTRAISVTTVRTGVDPVRPLLPVRPGAMPDAALTRPTTVYATARPAAGGLLPADAARPRPGEAHAPLAVMLVLTQWAAGVLGVEALLGLLAPRPAGTAAIVVALALAGVGFAASVAHLGRPLQAFRVVLGLRTSWMSREIVTFGVFAAVGVAYLGTLAAAAAASGAAAHGPAAAVGGAVSAAGARLAAASPPLAALWPAPGARAWPLALAVLALAGVASSVMIYAVTGRALWSWRRTAVRFAGTTVAGGAALALAALALPAARAGAWTPAALAGALAAATAVKLVAELALLAPGAAPGTALARTAGLLRGPLRALLVGRVALALLGGLVLPATLVAAMGAAAAGGALGGAPIPALALAMLAALLAAELLERHLFFTAMAAPAMPGC